MARLPFLHVGESGMMMMLLLSEVVISGTKSGTSVGTKVIGVESSKIKTGNMVLSAPESG